MNHALSLTASMDCLHRTAREQARERTFVSIKRRSRGDAEMHRKYNRGFCRLQNHCFLSFLSLGLLFMVNTSTAAVNPENSTWKNCRNFYNYVIIWAVTIQVCWSVTPCSLLQKASRPTRDLTVI
jgi:hypothetical protein